MPVAARLAALAGGLLALAAMGPAAAALTIGEDGRPVDPDCAREPGGDETMRPEFDGSLSYPGDGCTATFRAPAEPPTWLRYRMLGNSGHGCGLFVLHGALEAVSPLRCGRDGDNLTVPLQPKAGQGTRFNLTWHPFVGDHDNALVCAVGDGALPPGSAEGFPCLAWPDDGAACFDLAAEPRPDGVLLRWAPQPGADSYRVWLVGAGSPASPLVAGEHAPGPRAEVKAPAGAAMVAVTAFAGPAFLSASCAAQADVPWQEEVPAFPTAGAVAAALAVVAAVAWRMRRQA